MREVREETGHAVPPEAVGPLVWTQTATFRWRGLRHVARHEGRVARLDALAPPADLALTDVEVGTLLEARWWDVDEVRASEERFFPGSLPALLPRVLAGERVDEPFDVWD